MPTILIIFHIENFVEINFNIILKLLNDKKIHLKGIDSEGKK